jgi:hypothetical protein
MTRTYRPIYRSAAAVFFTAVLFIPFDSLYSQQSSLQTSFFAPAALRIVTASVASTGVASTGVALSITEAVHLPYLKEVAKETKAIFQPTASDLLIQQAEQRFRNGKKAFQDRDFANARMEFDAAIDTMLTASDNPTDRRIFESKLEDMVDAIHRDDLSGMGAAAV